jgi:hypothetical protein
MEKNKNNIKVCQTQAFNMAELAEVPVEEQADDEAKKARRERKRKREEELESMRNQIVELQREYKRRRSETGLFKAEREEKDAFAALDLPKKQPREELTVWF